MSALSQDYLAGVILARLQAYRQGGGPTTLENDAKVAAKAALQAIDANRPAQTAERTEP